MNPIQLIKRLFRAQQTRITLEQRGELQDRANPRELKVYIAIDDEKRVPLGLYNFADSENLEEIAGFAVRYLERHKFRGKIIINTQADHKNQVLSGFSLSLFQSGLKDRYSYGEIKIEDISAKRSHNG